MSHIWSFSPDLIEKPSVREAYAPRKRQKHQSWICPEHVRLAQDMRRDYPRDDFGRRIDGKPRELKIDARPTIMKPERKTRLGWL
jgi:hypothetical protein